MIDPDEREITADGDIDLPVIRGHEYHIALSGNFGGGTVSVRHLTRNEPQTFKEYDDNGSHTSEGEAIFMATSKRIRINVSGSTTPSIIVRYGKVAV